MHFTLKYNLLIFWQELLVALETVFSISKSQMKSNVILLWWLIFFKLFIYFWLCWVFVSVRGLSPVGASGGHSSSRCAGLPPSRPLLLRSTGSRRAGSAVVAHGPSCSAACRILPDQGSNPCPLHWQADSQPLRHQGSPWWLILCVNFGDKNNPVSWKNCQIWKLR